LRRARHSAFGNLEDAGDKKHEQAHSADQESWGSVQQGIVSIDRRGDGIHPAAAYELFRARDAAQASDLDDWFNAERELFEVPSGEMRETRMPSW
jgi:hypothetical protein